MCEVLYLLNVKVKLEKYLVLVAPSGWLVQ